MKPAKRKPRGIAARTLMAEALKELRLYEDANAASSDDAEHHLRAALILTLRALAAHLGVQP